jgi:hypothetical protein
MAISSSRIKSVQLVRDTHRILQFGFKAVPSSASLYLHNVNDVVDVAVRSDKGLGKVVFQFDCGKRDRWVLLGERRRRGRWWQGREAKHVIEWTLGMKVRCKLCDKEIQQEEVGKASTRMVS